MINARKQLTFLAALLLVATSGFAGGAAVAQTKNGFSLNDLPLAKLGAGAERRREFVAAERHYTYRAEVDCGEGATAPFVYTLREATGKYAEDYCNGEVLYGDLSYVSSDPVTIQGTQFQGFRYNGTDDWGEWSYFFGSDDLTGQGHYLVALAQGHYTADDPVLDPFLLATRTEP